MEWTLRLAGTEVDGQSRSFDLMAISRPDGLGEVANFGLTLTEAKLLLAQVQQQVVAAQRTFIRSRDDGERHLEARVGNVETIDGGRQVFGAITRAETDIIVLIMRTLETVGRTEATEGTAFTDGSVRVCALFWPMWE
jgi:hypothetical protein